MNSIPHPRTKQATAFHEAGHAVMANRLGLRLRKVTIIPSEGLAGYCQHFRGYRDKHMETGNDPYRVRLRIEKHIMTALAGMVAQKFYSRRSFKPIHARSDMENAAQMAMSITGSTKESNAFMEWLYIRTTNELKDSVHWEAVKALAAELLLHGELTGKQATKVIRETENSSIFKNWKIKIVDMTGSKGTQS
jgi:ATP-dependent Zn protease